MKETLDFVILFLLSCAVNLSVEVTVLCYMEPNRQLPSVTRVTGKVTLSQQSPEDRTEITVSLKGLTPYTVHGFHVHKYGDIIANGCQSCGGHYRPYGALHGGPRDQNRHVGDLGNVMSDKDGNIKTEFFDYLVSLYGPNSVIGRSLVLHAKVDDFGKGTGVAREESLKTGNAGARLGCCSIVYAATPQN